MSRAELTGLSVLVVEDDVLLRKQIAAFLERMGADVTVVDSIERTRKVVEDLTFDFVLLDVNLPDGTGTDLLRNRLIPATAGVIVMTAEGGVNGAVEAIRLGAIDYLVKPFDLAELPLVISRARRAKQTERLDEHQKRDAVRSGEAFFFGQALADMKAQLDKILTADARMQGRLPPVLIHGETGTGKTTIARWLHSQGPRAKEPLVEINCSALPESLAESELFGHERGAFTDARTMRMGLFEAADGGTLFLDELPSLSLSLQSKVLTSIEDHKIRRVGGNKEIPINVRIIAATNRDLRSLVANGEFREDLYHRLDLYRVYIPPLRDRGDDILNLAGTLLERLMRRHRLQGKKIHAAGRENLLKYRWPGNVRELAHELERALVFDESDDLRFEKLQMDGGQVFAGPRPKPASNPDEWFNEQYRFPNEGFYLEEAINRLIHHALKQTNQNVSAAARLLGVSRDFVRYRLSGQKTQMMQE